MGQFSKEQIENGLTGASFADGIGFYNELKNYSAGDDCLWGVSFYKANTNITGGTVEGDLSNAPDVSADWDIIESSMYNVYPSSVQTFTNTRVTVLLDTERFSATGFSLDGATGEITCNKDSDFLIILSATINISGTATSRSGSRVYLQKDTGGGFVDIANIMGSSYHRTYDVAEDSAPVTFAEQLNTGDKIRLQVVRYSGASLLETVPEGISLLFFENSKGAKGSKGDKGDKGDTGADGDITWQQTWSGTFNGGLGYDENMGVYYLGSSFISTVNGNTNTPHSGDPEIPNAGWSIWNKQGADGAGSSISLYDGGVIVPNGPHSAIDFTGDVTVTDIGGGTAEVNIVVPKNRYDVYIWAEENNGLSNNTYEWAFGNGANTPVDGGLTVYVPTGYTCEVIAMSLRVGGGTATVELVHNGVLQGVLCNVTVSSGQGNTNDSFTPVALSNGDFINFRTTTAVGTSGPCVVTAVLRFTEN